MSDRFEFGTPIGVIHDECALAPELMPKCESRADGAARISGGGLNVDAAKRRKPPHLAIGNRVHGAATRKCQIR